MPRSLDHIVLAVADLDRARTRYEELGFTVAPEGLHPFGTHNACIFLSDDTFIEPLAIARRETCEAAIEEGNTFVARDHAFRFRRGLEGLSHLVIKSDDAAADHEAFRAAGMSDGDMVHFSRESKTPDGNVGEAAFALAFAGDRRAPDAGFFSCEVVKSPEIDRTALRTHPNGAIGLAEVAMSEETPSDFQYFLQNLLEQREMDNHSFGIELALHGSRVSVLTAAGMRAFNGLDVETADRGLIFRSYSVRVANLDRTIEHLETNGVDYVRVLDRVLVPPAPGQGSPILFEESK